MEVKKIVLTGGPCAGKTTALAYLRQELENRGYFVIIVPEAATLAINAGLDPRFLSSRPHIIQTAIARIIISSEDALIEAAKKAVENFPQYKGVVCICDRGINDGLAYCGLDTFNRIIEQLGTNPVKARDTRYDAVMHLVTAACGAEPFYTTTNNTARRESPEEARFLDERTKRAWVGHPHLRVIDNKGDFQSKMHQLLVEVCAVLGIPEPFENERKFLVRVTSLPFPHVAVHIIQHYDGKGTRLRKRGAHGWYAHYLTQKIDTANPKKRIERESIITEAMYGERILVLPEGYRCGLEKDRHCFLHNNRYFELDAFRDPRAIDPGCCLLELETATDGDDAPPDLPAGIEIVREVTADLEYRNERIARRLYGNDDVPF